MFRRAKHCIGDYPHSLWDHLYHKFVANAFVKPRIEFQWKCNVRGYTAGGCYISRLHRWLQMYNMAPRHNMVDQRWETVKSGIQSTRDSRFRYVTCRVIRELLKGSCKCDEGY
jgi:hypothetical protein